MNELDTRLATVLKEADKLLLGLFENALTGVYLIQDGRFVYVNATLAGMFDYTQQEIIEGFTPLDLICPAARPLARSEIEGRLNGLNRASLYTFDALRKDGSRFAAEVFGVATVFDGQRAIIGTLHDISQRRETERELADQLEFVAGLLETIPSPVFYKDADGRYLGCNKAFEDLNGISRGGLIGRSVFDLWERDLAERYYASDQQLFANPGTQTYEAAVKDADGLRREVIYYKATFRRADGNLGGLVGVILDISERKRMEAHIWRAAHYDTLTGLPNRRLFEECLQRDFDRARQSHGRLALLFVDLDRFKAVNDLLGHRAGDLLLIEAGERIRHCLREDDLVARLGGDEFIVALSSIESPASAGEVARRIIAALVRPFDLVGQNAYVSASIGIALYPDDADSIERLMCCADQAMYSAKQHGRNGYRNFVPAYREAARERGTLVHDLRGALARGELALHYQPILRLSDGALVRVEALLRWRHPDKGMIPPRQFIPVAEEIGLIGEIGEWVFHEACRDLQAWNADRPAGQPPVRVSINKSPRQLLNGDGHTGWLAQLHTQHIPPEYFGVEITEGALLDAREDVALRLRTFRDAGVQVSLDDFGTGYSALAYLKKFAIDVVKIDRSFIAEMESSASDRAIVEAIIAMAHKLGIKVVAEGVETDGQHTLLAEAGCEYAQGFLFSHPLPAAELAAGLRQRWGSA